MGYSVRSTNGADQLSDDTNLFRFAWKRARNYHVINGSNGTLLDIVEKPFIFVGTLISAPFLHKVNNAYCYGTPEWEERVSKIRVKSHPRGIGVIVEYPE